MASIRRRGPGQFRARIRRAGFPEQSATLSTRELAERWARDIETAMDEGRFVGMAEAARLTLGDALARYAREVTIGKRSADQEARRIALLREHPLAGVTLADLRGSDLADFRDARLAGIPFTTLRELRARDLPTEGVAGARPVKANTVRLELAIIGHLFTIARTEWGMESLASPLKAIRKPAAGGGRERRLEDGEEARLLRAAAASLRPLIVLALETAMRRGELAGLHWGGVDLVRRVVRLELTKNGDDREVPLTARAVELLQALKARPSRWSGGWVFGPPELVAARVTREFQRTTRRAGIKALTFHDLRHEATSRLFERGLGIAEVAAITGHKTLTMLKRYTHLRAEDLVAKLGPAPVVASMPPRRPGQALGSFRRRARPSDRPGAAAA